MASHTGVERHQYQVTRRNACAPLGMTNHLQMMASLGIQKNPMGLAIALPINAVIRVLVMNDERHYDLIRDRERNEHDPRQDKHESVG